MEKPRIECVDTYRTEEGLTYSKFVAEPLERGYGTTLGNALRRVLLSGIEGAAITAIRINGVAHEFTSIPGVVEDVIDIVLNLKGVVLKMITTDADVEVMNPEWPIATLDEGSLEIEFSVERGKGFVTAERNRKPNLAMGVIPIDSIFMPVRKVNYLVGSRASKEDSGKPQPTDMPIEELELSVRAYNCLKRANIYTVGDLLKKSERDLMDIKNFGKKSAEEVIERMRTLGYNMAAGDLDDSYATSGDL